MTFLEGDIETAVQVCYFAISSYLETLSGMVIILIKTVKLISSLRSLVLPWSNKSCCKNLLNLLAHLLDNFQSSVFARSSISSFVEHFSRKSRWVLGSALFKWTVRISFLLELLSIWCQYKRMRRSTAEQGLSQIHFFGTHNTSTRSSSLKINVFSCVYFLHQSENHYIACAYFPHFCFLVSSSCLLSFIIILAKRMHFEIKHTQVELAYS